MHHLEGTNWSQESSNTTLNNLARPEVYQSFMNDAWDADIVLVFGYSDEEVGNSASLYLHEYCYFGFFHIKLTKKSEMNVKVVYVLVKS